MTSVISQDVFGYKLGCEGVNEEVLPARAPSQCQARGVHTSQDEVTVHPGGLPHQAAHVWGEGLWTVDQLLDLF